MYYKNILFRRCYESQEIIRNLLAQSWSFIMKRMKELSNFRLVSQTQLQSWIKNIVLGLEALSIQKYLKLTFLRLNLKENLGRSNPKQ